MGNARDVAGAGGFGPTLLLFMEAHIMPVLFLASPAAAHVTGDRIILDGGVLIAGVAHL